MSEESELIRLSTSFKKALEDRGVSSIERLVRAYERALQGLKAEFEALMLRAAEEGITASKLTKLARFRRLEEQIIDVLDEYSIVLRHEITESVDEALRVAAEDSIRLMKAATTETLGVSLSFEAVPHEAVIELLGFLDPEGPLYKKIELLAPAVADHVTGVMIEGIALGRNPRVIARELHRAFGIGLTHSMRLVRTAQLWSYREASRANYIRNSDIISGWIWHSALIPGRTCMSCVAMHGTEHELTETLDDHHNGLCTMIPIVARDPIEVEAGTSWFKKQPETIQKAMMGPSKYEAWKKGDISLDSLTHHVEDRVYGQIRTEPALKTLLEDPEYVTLGS